MNPAEPKSPVNRYTTPQCDPDANDAFGDLVWRTMVRLVVVALAIGLAWVVAYIVGVMNGWIAFDIC